MTAQEATDIAKRELGSTFVAWRRGDLYFLGRRINGARVNQYVSSKGYEDLLGRAGLSMRNRALTEAYYPRCA
jgi:hypothetical protein